VSSRTGGQAAKRRAAGRGSAATRTSPPKAPPTISGTLSNLLLIGLGLHGVGILGTCLAIGIALRSAGDKLPVGEKISFPLLLLIVVLGTYICFASVHGAALYLIRRGGTEQGLTMMAFGGGVLAIATIAGGFYAFGERFFMLGAAAAYAVPYSLAPLIVGLPTTAAAAVLAFRQRRGGTSSRSSGRPQRAQQPRLLR